MYSSPLKAMSFDMKRRPISTLIQFIGCLNNEKIILYLPCNWSKEKDNKHILKIPYLI